MLVTERGEAGMISACPSLGTTFAGPKMICPECQSECEEGARFCPSCGASLINVEGDADHDPYIGMKIRNSFLIESMLGEGGMGRVYQATQLSLDKTVAVKILHKHLTFQDKRVASRFKQEAKSASMLEHPNSIQIIDFGQIEQDGSLFIAMEFLSGKPLSDVIESEFPLSARRVTHIMAQTCSVLAEAHNKGIIHRDLKPENIVLVDRSGDPDFVKVLDFGIAKLKDRAPDAPALTQTGMVCGTPEYMAPEQAMGQELDHRSDIYALGVVLYEMLTGELPFTATNYPAILSKHIREPLVPPSKQRPDLNIPRALEEICQRATAKAKDDRYPTCKEMYDDLEAIFNVGRPKVTTAMIRDQALGSITGRYDPADRPNKPQAGPEQDQQILAGGTLVQAEAIREPRHTSIQGQELSGLFEELETAGVAVEQSPDVSAGAVPPGGTAMFSAQPEQPPVAEPVPQPHASVPQGGATQMTGVGPSEQPPAEQPLQPQQSMGTAQNALGAQSGVALQTDSDRRPASAGPGAAPNWGTATLDADVEWDAPKRSGAKSVLVVLVILALAAGGVWFADPMGWRATIRDRSGEGGRASLINQGQEQGGSEQGRPEGSNEGSNQGESGQSEQGRPDEGRPEQVRAGGNQGEPDSSAQGEDAQQPPDGRQASVQSGSQNRDDQRRVVRPQGDRNQGRPNPRQALRFYEAGNRYFQRNQFRQALERYKKAQQADPNMARVYKRIGDCYFRTSRYPQAAKQYEIYLQKMPNAPERDFLRNFIQSQP